MSEVKEVKAVKAIAASAESDVNSLLVAASKTGTISGEQFTALFAVMMAKEARIAAKELALEESLKARDEQRRRDSDNYTVAKIETQKACRHLKGGRGRQRGQQKDPAVYLHTFTNGAQVIKCQLCGAKWKPKDTDEYLDINGMKVPNWTKIGWGRALEMAEDSSNKPSSSERFGGVVAGVTPKTAEGLAVPNMQI
ncbi:Uncharacterised protein [uncultured archaeon]|nr:Uncharacterised protein [uncultured archaeon]